MITPKSCIGFCLNTRKRFFLEVSFWNQQKEHRFFWKIVVRILETALRFGVGLVFMWEPLEILNVFNSITLKQILWKTKTFFKKLEYLFLVENTKIENTTFRNTTTLPEANVKTNRMGSTKLTYHKEQSFVSNHFPFSKILFLFRNLVFRLDLMYQPPKRPYSYFSKALEFYFRVFFSLRVSLKSIWIRLK